MKLYIAVTLVLLAIGVMMHSVVNKGLERDLDVLRSLADSSPDSLTVAAIDSVKYSIMYGKPINRTSRTVNIVNSLHLERKVSWK